VTWNPEYAFVLAATPGGSVVGAIGSQTFGPGSTWVLPGEVVLAQETPKSGPPGVDDYRFVGWNGSGPGAVTSSEQMLIYVAPAGPVTELAQFAFVAAQAERTYRVTFHVATPIAAGTAWTVSVGPIQSSSTTPTLNVVGLVNSSYTVSVATAYSPTGLLRYVPQKGTISRVDIIGANLTEVVAFGTEDWVDVGASAGGTVSVTLPATGLAAPSMGWYAMGSVLALTAIPSGGHFFESWNGTVGSTWRTMSVTVGGPMRELALFEPAPPGPSPPVATFGSPVLWGVYGGEGLAFGVGVAWIVFGRPPPPVPRDGHRTAAPRDPRARTHR